MVNLGKYICFGVGVLASLCLGNEIIRGIIEGKNYISTNGLAVQSVESDIAKWNISIVNETDSLKEAQLKRVADKKAVLEFLENNGFDKLETSEDSFEVEDQQRDSDAKAQKRKYKITDNIVVYTPKAKLVKKVSGSIADLMDKNILISSKISYYYKDIDNLRLKMIEHATKDALERAECVGKTLKSKISALRSLSTGQFSITSEDTAATSERDYTDGEYALNKKIKVVVHATFNIM